MDLLLPTTTGARSGRSRTTPVTYFRDGDRYLLVASNYGKPHHPDWYHNLKVDPQVTVQVGGERFAARAVVLAGGERDRAFDAAYQDGVTRTIPVVALEPADPA